MLIPQELQLSQNSALSVPPTKFFKKGYELAEIGEMLSGIGDPAFISL